MAADDAPSIPASPAAASKYRRIARHLRHKILAGVYTDRIPSERRLARSYGVHVLTANKAVSSLVDDGLLYRVKGIGTFVTRLKRARAGNLAAVVGDVRAPLHARAVRGMDAAASRHAQHLLFRNHFDHAQRELDFIEQLLSSEKADGFLVWPTRWDLGSPGLRRLARGDVPFVVFPHIDPAASGVSCVVSNDCQAARLAVRHLVELGHRHIAFVITRQWLDGEPMLSNRQEGYEQAMAQADLEPPPRIVLDPAVPWESKPALPLQDLTALFCITDDVAIEVLKGLRLKGVGVPDDVCVVGLDGTPRAADFDLTTVEQPMEAIGSKAVEVLLDEIEGRRKQPAHVVLEPRLVERGSTRRIAS